MGLAPAFVHTVEVPGAAPAALGEVAHKAQQHLVHLRQGGRLGGPIVLFQIDVGGVVTAPRRVHALVPKALQVGRNAYGTGTGNEQVAAILEVKGLKFGIGLPFCVTQKLLIGGQGAHGGVCTAQVQGYTVEEFCIIGLVALPEGLPAQCRSRRSVMEGTFLIFFPLLHRVFVKAIEAGAVAYHNHRFLNTADV